jgi:hypothetical protein
MSCFQGHRRGSRRMSRRPVRTQAGGDVVDAAADPLGHHVSQIHAQPGGPSSEVVRDGVQDQPCCVPAEALGREVAHAHAVLEVADGQLDFGVPALIGFEVEEVAGPVGDDRVVVEDRNRGSWPRFLACSSVGGVRRTISRTVRVRRARRARGPEVLGRTG